MLRQRMGLVLIGTWAILSVALLGNFLYERAEISATVNDHGARSELEVKLGWGLLILNFPISLGMAALPIDLDTDPITDWCILSLVGFFQWAVIVPLAETQLRKLIGRLRRRSPT